MKAKLIKVEDVYRLLREDNLIIGTTDYEYQKAFSDHCYKLSLKNCQAIERGYDLDELVEGFIEKTGYHDFDSYSYKLGFQKALELMGDKKFSEEDMFRMFTYGHALTNAVKSKVIQDKPFGEIFNDFIQSLQQTEWDVEIVTFTEDDLKSVSEDWGKLGKPKLDADGCLILKRV